MTDEGEQRCDQCGRVFSTKKILRRHIRETHVEEAALQFRCSECGKRFSRNSNLVRHMLVHKGEGIEDKKHHCPYCDAKFRQRCHLSEHTLIHSGTRFTCKTCRKSFSRNQPLKSHMQCAHGMDKCAVDEESCQHLHCKKIAFMTHDGHIDFLLSCGSISCHSSERVLPVDKAVGSKESKTEATLQCPHEECGSHTAEKDLWCDPFKKARVVKHGGSLRYRFQWILMEQRRGRHVC